MSKRPRYVLCPVGSAGDVFPFVAVGRALAARDREVLVLGTENFRSLVEEAGLTFLPTGSAEDFEAVKRTPDLWHPRRGFQVVMRLVLDELPRVWRLLDDLVDPERDVLVAHMLALAARLHEERHGTRSSMLHLAPSAFRSEFAQPVMSPGMNLERLPRVMRRAFWWLIDRFYLDRVIRPRLDRFRAELGLPPQARVFKDWIHPRGGVIALFPEVFGPAQPDWPRPFAHAGFAAWDGPEEIPEDLERWLASRAKAPVVVTPGSANLFGAAYGRAAAEAAAIMDRPFLFLSSRAAGTEDADPELLRHEPWAPLGRVLASAAALVHHGGIGSTARGLLSGKPQVIVPMAFDQPDNAARVERLGAGGSLVPGKLDGRSLATLLEQLLASEAVGRRCRELATTLDGAGAERAAAILIDRHG
ncbi:MAG: glycosyltransferase family 1 protein [Planctomycetes bacterium]|nr:glycosyltransferase family 1 protein [Planctomycetota bacterium]